MTIGVHNLTDLVNVQTVCKSTDLQVYKWSGMKSKVRARAAELNAEPELFQFKANITYLIKSKAKKEHILCNQQKNLRKIMTFG